MKRKLLGGVAAGVCLAWLCGAAPPADAAPKPGDWPSYGYDQASTKYSPLTQITAANVQGLAVAWTYHMNPDRASGAAVRASSTTTPLVADGRMYVGTPFGRVVALDPSSGRELWVYTLPAGDQPALRGLGYWPGDQGHPPRLIFGTLRGAIIALDAATGRPAAGFGVEGVLDTKTPEIMNGQPTTSPYTYSAPPSIYRNLAIFGSRLPESGAKGAAGDVRAWDVVTGKLAWTFHSVPRAGETGYETWEGDSWRQRTGANMWNMATVDTERGIAYLALGAPTYDRYGGDRKGSNLFSSSVVAVNANTGKYLWHFQAVHHDIWDYDQNTAPTLLTVRRGGRSIPAVAVMNKTALLFLLDRVTGKPIYGVTERPTPPATAPGDVAWPTQPFPNKPEPLTRMSFDLSELADITPEHRAACQAMIDKDGAVGTKAFEPRRADRPSISFPGGAGGPEWGSGAFDPRLGYYVFSSNQVGYLEKIQQRPDGEWMHVGGRFLDPVTRSPCQKPPWGELIAVNVNTGDVAWRSLLGVTDAFPEGKRNTGRPGNGGPIITASGLIFVAGTDDRRIRAFETRTGREIWSYTFDYAAHATPLTYQGADGRQFVAVVATGGSVLNSPLGGDSVVAFALPTTNR